MTPTPALQRFVDDELVRVPLILEHTLQAVMEGLQKGHSALAPGERQVVGDLMLRLGSHRKRVVDRFVASLSEQVKAELLRSAPHAAAAPQGRGMLSLVDDDEVAIDVAISHTIEAIKSVAEQELRELLTFTSALAGDMDVASDHNPLRAETQARALWAAVQAVPLSRGHQLSLMRHAAMPLAQALRKAYAATCVRLEAAGIAPAAYRTVIPPAGPRSAKPVAPVQRPDLQHILASMPVQAASATPQRAQDLEFTLRLADQQWRQLPVDAGPTEHGRVRDSQRARLAQLAGAPVDRQVMELLSRLFDALLTDPRLPVPLHGAISRLQGFALRVVLRDPSTLDALDHPLWHFMDRLAHEAVVYPGVAGEQHALLMQFATGLIDKLSDETQHTAQLYRWAEENLENFARNRLAQRCAAAAEEIGTMQALEDRMAQPGGTPSTFHGALDAGQLDTVPAALLDTLHAADKADVMSGPKWVAQRRAGEWMRVFRKGGWVNAQLLWPGERGEIWLFANGDAELTWAIRRSALLLLHDEGLIDELRPRSLMHDAAERLLRRLGRDRQT